jgi:hypothetical protein
VSRQASEDAQRLHRGQRQACDRVGVSSLSC